VNGTGGIIMKNDFLYEALKFIHEAQERILKTRETIEDDKADTASNFDNTNRAFEQLNSARIFIKEAISSLKFILILRLDQKLT
jgi:hypothetical protein